MSIQVHAVVVRVILTPEQAKAEKAKMVIKKILPSQRRETMPYYKIVGTEENYFDDWLVITDIYKDCSFTEKIIYNYGLKLIRVVSDEEGNETGTIVFKFFPKYITEQFFKLTIYLKEGNITHREWRIDNLEHAWTNHKYALWALSDRSEENNFCELCGDIRKLLATLMVDE